MEAREKLIGELRTVCTTAGLDYDNVSTELLEFLDHAEIVDYYVTKGAPPFFPDLLFDVMILGEKALYDYDMRKQGVLLHFQPLRAITEIGEAFVEVEYLTVHFKIGELGGGVVIQDKLSESKNMRRFAKAVRDKII